MRKRSRHEPTDSYFYVSRQLVKSIMRLNLHVGPVRTQMTNTQKMNIYEMNKQNIPNLYVCSLDESKPKRINTDETLSHVCSMENRE